MFEIRDGQLVFTKDGLPPGEHCVSATWDGETLRTYIDGEPC